MTLPLLLQQADNVRVVTGARKRKEAGGSRELAALGSDAAGIAAAAEEGAGSGPRRSTRHRGS
jgi:hypothetical protein